MFPNTYDTGGGWTCGECGAYVPNGVTHTHFHYNQPYQYPSGSFYNSMLIELLERISKTLDRILEVLEGNKIVVRGALHFTDKDRE